MQASQEVAVCFLLRKVFTHSFRHTLCLRHRSPASLPFTGLRQFHHYPCSDASDDMAVQKNIPLFYSPKRPDQIQDEEREIACSIVLGHLFWCKAINEFSSGFRMYLINWNGRSGRSNKDLLQCCWADCIHSGPLFSGSVVLHS